MTAPGGREIVLKSERTASVNVKKKERYETGSDCCFRRQSGIRSEDSWYPNEFFIGMAKLFCEKRVEFFIKCLWKR